MTGGSLQSRLYDAQAPRLSARQRVALLDGVLSGLEHLHNHTPTIVHLDVKPANILFDGLFDKLTAKLCDFGLSRHIIETLGGDDRSQVAGSVGQSSSMTYRGTRGFMDPLLLDEEPGPTNDGYALGITILLLLTAHKDAGAVKRECAAMLEQPTTPDRWGGINFDPEWQSAMPQIGEGAELGAAASESFPVYRGLQVALATAASRLVNGSKSQRWSLAQTRGHLKLALDHYDATSAAEIAREYESYEPYNP